MKVCNLVMASIFWNTYDKIFIDCLVKGKTITDVLCSGTGRLNNEIKRKRSHLAKKKVLFYQANAPAPKGTIAMAKLHELRYRLLLLYHLLPIWLLPTSS